jgi:DNA gyrase subunit A
MAGRSTQGVIVMRFKEESDSVIAMALADKEPEETTAAEGETIEGETNTDQEASEHQEE